MRFAYVWRKVYLVLTKALSCPGECPSVNIRGILYTIKILIKPCMICWGSALSLPLFPSQNRSSGIQLCLRRTDLDFTHSLTHTHTQQALLSYPALFSFSNHTASGNVQTEPTGLSTLLMTRGAVYIRVKSFKICISPPLQHCCV